MPRVYRKCFTPYFMLICTRPCNILNAFVYHFLNDVFFFFFNFHNNDTPNTQLVIFYSNRNRSESRIWEKSLKAKILSRRVNDLSVRWNNVFMKNQLFRKPTVRGVSAFALISQCFCDAIMNNNSYYTDNTTRYESIISVRPDFIYHVTAVTSNYLVV